MMTGECGDDHVPMLNGKSTDPGAFLGDWQMQRSFFDDLHNEFTNLPAVFDDIVQFGPLQLTTHAEIILGRKYGSRQKMQNGGIELQTFFVWRRISKGLTVSSHDISSTPVSKRVS